MECNCSENNRNFGELDEFIDQLANRDESALIQVLHHAQGLFGYLPRNVQIHVAQKLGVPIAKVSGVVSFYSFFTDTARGEHVIQVCMGTGCFVKGSGKVLEALENELGIKAGETTEDMKFTLSSVRCIGACGLAPVITINDQVFGHVGQDEVGSILEKYVIEAAQTK